MAMLTCDVTTCSYNEKKRCAKGDIMVGGKEAMGSKETCCESFRDQEKDVYKSSMDHPSTIISIDCEAEHCVYNAAYKCHAQEVGITGCGAHECKQTNCATFKVK